MPDQRTRAISPPGKPSDVHGELSLGTFTVGWFGVEMAQPRSQIGSPDICDHLDKTCYGPTVYHCTMVKMNELNVCVFHLSKMMLIKKSRFPVTYKKRQGSIPCKTILCSVYGCGYVGNTERTLTRLKLLVV